MEIIRLKISYERQVELDKVLHILKPVIKTYKISKNTQGKFKKAYADIDFAKKK